MAWDIRTHAATFRLERLARRNMQTQRKGPCASTQEPGEASFGSHADFLTTQESADSQAPDTQKGIGRKDDSEKPRFTLLPHRAIFEVVRVLEHGARRYGPDNWRKLEGFEVRYLDALYRHLHAHLTGQVVDPDSGISHLAHVATNALFLLEGPSR